MKVTGDQLSPGDAIEAFGEPHTVEAVHPDDGGAYDVWLRDREHESDAPELDDTRAGMLLRLDPGDTVERTS